MSDLDAGKRGWSRYPHIVLRDGEYLWTSVHVALVKSPLTAAEWRRRAPGLPPRTSLKWRFEKGVLQPLARAKNRVARSRRG